MDFKLNEMETDIEITEVIFRKDKNGVFALFPHCVDTLDGNVMSYQHIGQHSAAEYNHCITKSVPASPEEYESLLAELISIGYNLKIIRRQDYTKFLASYTRVNKL